MPAQCPLPAPPRTLTPQCPDLDTRQPDGKVNITNPIYFFNYTKEGYVPTEPTALQYKSPLCNDAWKAALVRWLGRQRARRGREALPARADPGPRPRSPTRSTARRRS